MLVCPIAELLQVFPTSRRPRIEHKLVKWKALLPLINNSNCCEATVSYIQGRRPLVEVKPVVSLFFHAKVFCVNYIVRESNFFTYLALGSFLINQALSGHLLGDINKSVNASQTQASKITGQNLIVEGCKLERLVKIL